ncbi:HEPN domain-containing protein [Streptomyces pseudogriseolus]|uniref:HEPN domain-containing protein n=1 Tax=Streptomyces pseudogriseolus TaxID=36817 RepID=UPI003247A84D
MPKDKFKAQLAEVHTLLNLADSIDFRDPALTYLAGPRPKSAPLLAGAVVLLCARFEEFIKDVVTYALERHNVADPPVALWDLPEEVQVRLISRNMSAALEANRHGGTREYAVRINDGVAAAQALTAGKIEAQFAITTSGNPSPETIKDLMRLAGVESPWRSISRHFESTYAMPVIPGLPNPVIGGLEERLRQILKVRNMIAHSGATIPSSSAEIRFNVDFLSQLSDSVYAVLKETIERVARSKGRQPAPWNT